jgi:hypothetical protein
MGIWSLVPSIVSDGDFSSRKILAIYGCSFVSIAGVMKGSRFFVLKIIWIRMDDRDWGMGVSSLSDYFAPSALTLSVVLKPGPLAQAIAFRAVGAESGFTARRKQSFREDIADKERR